MRIYVTDGNNRACLAIVRSLGKLGHEVFVGEKKNNSLSGSSKYCRASLVYPDPANEGDLFPEIILNHIISLNIDVLIPVSDVTTMLIKEHSDQFEKHCSIPTASYKQLRSAADKNFIIKLAQVLGVPIPKTQYIEEKKELDKLDVDLCFPVVIKPSKSRVKQDHGWLFTSVSYANNNTELMEQLNNTHKDAFPILLQERITGPGIGVFVCYNKGNLVAKFSHRRLREKPPSGGVSVLRESIDVDPIALSYSEKLLQALDWHGVAMVEFKVDERDNLPKLMEINGRFWGSLQLSIDSGVDFPAILINTLEKKEMAPVTNYKLGVKTRWLCGDLDRLLMILFKSKKSLNTPPNFPGRILSTLEFLRFWGKDLNYEVLSTSDMRPFITEVKQWIKSMGSTR